MKHPLTDVRGFEERGDTMIIGVPKEIKADEYRVALLPVGAQLLAGDGHTVLIEQGAGVAAGFDDEQYVKAGARVVSSATEIYAQANLVVKVKEPQVEEIAMLRRGQSVFCYFHFASSADLTTGCLASGITAVAYETLADAQGRLPLLTPMSEIAGKIAIQQGAIFLERTYKGSGILLGGVPGVARANVLILGGGTVGINAARIAAGLGANVVIMDIDLDRMRYLEEIMPVNVTTIYCDPHAVEEYAVWADLIIGAVLIPGGRTPILIKRKLLSKMKPGSVIVDVAVDQGGCIETCRPTTHHDPIFIIDDIVHYCVANIPAAVCKTSSRALCNATLPYVRELAHLGVEKFAALSPGRAAAVNMYAGKIVNSTLAAVFPDLPAADKF